MVEVLRQYIGIMQILEHLTSFIIGTSVYQRTYLCIVLRSVRQFHDVRYLISRWKLAERWCKERNISGEALLSWGIKFIMMVECLLRSNLFLWRCILLGIQVMTWFIFFDFNLVLFKVVSHSLRFLNFSHNTFESTILNIRFYKVSFKYILFRTLDQKLRLLDNF